MKESENNAMEHGNDAVTNGSVAVDNGNAAVDNGNAAVDNGNAVDESDQELFARLAAQVPEIKTLLRAGDTNPWGCIHGGVIMTHLDNAGGMAAISYSGHPVVTRVFTCNFLEPVLVGDLVSVYVDVVKVGHSSLTCHGEMIANRFNPQTCTHSLHRVATADMVYVAVDGGGKAVEIKG